MRREVIQQSVRLWTMEPEKAKIFGVCQAWLERCPIYSALTKPLAVKAALVITI